MVLSVSCYIDYVFLRPVRIRDYNRQFLDEALTSSPPQGDEIFKQISPCSPANLSLIGEGFASWISRGQFERDRFHQMEKEEDNFFGWLTEDRLYSVGVDLGLGFVVFNL